MTHAQFGFLAGVREPLLAVAPDDLQQPVTGRALRPAGQDDGLGHQPIDEVRHRAPCEAVRGADTFGRLQG